MNRFQIFRTLLQIFDNENAERAIVEKFSGTDLTLEASSNLLVNQNDLVRRQAHVPGSVPAKAAPAGNVAVLDEHLLVIFRRRLRHLLHVRSEIKLVAIW
jgi:hypothetical protein